MNLPVLVDVAVGLAFLYLIVSLLAAVLNETIMTVLEVRADKLKRTIESLLDDADLREHFYNSSIFTSVNTFVADVMGGRTSAPGASAAGNPGAAHPSYLDSKTFATAMVTSLIKQAEAKAGTLAAASAMTRAVTLVDLRNAVNALPESRIRTTLQSLTATGEQTIEGFQDRLAIWFDGCMARLSGVFKRYATNLSIAVGFVLAAALNADSFAVGHALGTDGALRGAVVESASKYLESHATYEPDDCTDAGGAKVADRLKCEMKTVSDQAKLLAPLPLGWSSELLARQQAGYTMTSACDFAWWWGLKVLGFLATALAVSLGAPFWFDVLQMFMKIRNTGPKPADTTLAADVQPK